MASLREPAIHHEGNAIFGYDGGNHFVRNGKARPRGVFCCERKPTTCFPSGQTRISPDEMTGCSLDELVVDYELFERGV